MIHLNTHLSKRNEDVNEVDDSFEHTLIKEKWRCKWSRWFDLSKRNEDVNRVDDTHFNKEKWRCKSKRNGE